jgi:UPF0755 protein
MMKVFKILVIIGFIGSALVAWFTYEYFEQPLALKSDTIITVTQGDSMRSIGRDLYNKEVLSSIDTFVLWSRILKQGKYLKTGEYNIPVGTSMAGLFAILKSGKSIGYRVVVPEGSNMFDVALLLEKAELCSAANFLKVATNRKFVKSLLGEGASSLEGYLFPDTYFFTKVDGAKLIATKMVHRFDDKYLQVQKPEGWSRQQFVTLASIIEKETGAPFERPKISSVFHNRLQKGMRLQTDPTVMYAKLLKSGQIQTNISKADLSMEHPYNTYMHKGLPPGPISNPGIESLQAAAHPETTDFLFFVSKNDGTHVFTTTYKEHTSAVSAYQVNPKAREGKSWRDLKKKIVAPQPSAPPKKIKFKNTF